MAYKDKEKDRRRRREAYRKNIEVMRERKREAKKRARLEQGERVREYAREWYQKNRVSEARKQNERRIKRNPHIGLRSAICNYERGVLELDKLIELLGERFASGTQIFGSKGGLSETDE